MIQNEPIIRRGDMIRCALCAHAPCDSACDRLDPARLLVCPQRAISPGRKRIVKG